MITQIVIDLLTNILQTIINIVNAIYPQINITSYMLIYTSKIISICTQANNFIHFMLGDFVVVLVPLTIALLGYKYLLYPIIVLVRSVFVNGNN